MIQCQGCTCAGWLWEGEGGLGDHQPGVYVPLKALFLVNNAQIAPEHLSQYDRTVYVGRKTLIKDTNKILLKRTEIDDIDHWMAKH